MSAEAYSERRTVEGRSLNGMKVAFQPRRG